MGPITPTLWINGEDMDAAASYYTDVFGGSVVHSLDYGPEAGELAGVRMLVVLDLNGQQFSLLNGGGHHFTPNESVSFELSLDDQAEVDRVWDHFAKEGRPGPCGWIADRYGFSWQVVPSVLNDMLRDPDPERVARVTACFMAVDGRAFDIEELRAAYDGR